MKPSKRLIAIFLGVLILVGTIGGCTPKEQKQGSKNVSTSSDSNADNGKSYLNKEGFPIVNEPITLTAMASRNVAVQPEFKDIYVWQEYEKMTGITIEWQEVPSSDLAEKRNLALASGEFPDLFIRGGIPDIDLVKYGEQGTFINLKELIDEYGPNLKKIMENEPDVKRGLVEHNGNIYGYPTVYFSDPVQISTRLFINTKWLEKVNLGMPSTTDELYEVLKAFRDTDLNGNGKKDEIPWTSNGLGYLFNMLKGAWGLQNRGSSHPNVDINEKTGELRFIPTSDQYKDMLEYMHRLYSEKLIDEEIFTMDHAQLVAKGEQNLVGSFASVNSQLIGSTHEKEFAGIEVALKGPNGDQLWTPKSASLAAKGPFVITNKCKYPEAAVRWVDYFYSDEGTRLFYMGVEGVTYEKKADGSYEFLEEIKKIPEGSSFDHVLGKWVPYMGGGNPAILKTEYFKGGETQPIPLKASTNMAPYTPKELWSKFSYFPQEVERMAELENDILTYITQMNAQFIMGTTTFDQWDDYVKQIEKMGLEEYMKIYQTAYDRYSKN